MQTLLIRFKNRTLASRLILIIIVFLILPFLFFYIQSYIKIEDKTKKQVEQITVESNRQISMSITNLLDNVVNISTYFLSERNVTEAVSALKDPLLAPYERLQYYQKLDNTIASITNSLLPQETIIALASHEQIYYSTVPVDTLNLSLFLEQVSAQFPEVEEATPVFPYYHTDYLSTQPDTRYLSCIRTLLPDGYDSLPCFLIVSLPTDVFRNFLIPANGNFLLKDSQGHVVYTTPDGEISDCSAEDHIVSAIDISTYGLQLINIIHTNKIYQDVHILRNQFLLRISIWTAFFLTITFLLIYHQLRPLVTLKQHMLQIQNGNLDARISADTTSDEIGLLTQSFNSMLERINQLIQEIQEKQKQESELRFEMLLAQINPHFLFNTLNSIKWMSIVAQTETITTTITSLGRLLEISMNRMNDIISVKDELENIRSYIQIQQLRYAGQFSVQYQIDPVILSLSSPKLMLQPIVENAILHNVSSDHNLKILIQGMLKQDNIVFHITDNGTGMTQEQIHDILTTTAKEKNHVFRGIGVRNVNERIRLLYGDAYGVTFHSRAGYYTKVTILLPAQQCKGEPTI